MIYGSLVKKILVATFAIVTLSACHAHNPHSAPYSNGRLGVYYDAPIFNQTIPYGYGHYKHRNWRSSGYGHSGGHRRHRNCH